MAKKQEEKAVVELKEAAVPMVVDFEQDAGGGFDGLSAKDLAIPFIGILQQLSPQVQPVKAGGLEGAEVGMIFNTVTQECVDGDEGIIIVPCAYQKKYIEWKPRQSGGGFVKMHDSEEIMTSTVVDDRNDSYLPNGNTVVPTANYYALVLKPNGQEPETAVLSLTKTQLTTSKKWNSIMQAIRLQGKNGLYKPAMFSHKYRLTTILKEKSGFKWYGWEVTNLGPLTQAEAEVYKLAKKLNEEVEKGMLKVKPQADDMASGSAADEVM